jgi:hypothetical protein
LVAAAASRAHELRTEPLGFDDHVHHELAREAQEVRVGFIAARSWATYASLVGTRDLGDLVLVDRVDRGLRAHHSNLRRRECQARIGPSNAT